MCRRFGDAVENAGEYLKCPLDALRTCQWTVFRRAKASNAMTGNDAMFAHESAVETAWAVVERVLTTPSRAIVYPRECWSPPQAGRLAANLGGGTTTNLRVDAR